MPRQKPDVYRLNNGLRVVHQRIPGSRSVHCGFIVNTGSSSENAATNGVAHLIEHCVFKGTKRRKPYHILSRIENVGGEVEAFTTREKTVYFTSTLSRYADRSIELLTDILFNPVFPEAEVNKEKRVIREEIEMYEDMPEESLMDDFHGLIFSGHPLGFNELGTKRTLEGLSREEIVQFHRQHYVPGNMSVAIVGNVTPKKVSQIISRYLEPLPKGNVALQKSRPDSTTRSFQQTITKDFQQAYCILGSEAYGRHDDKRYAAAVLNTFLGGAGMSSKLNMEIREKYGYVYQIDTGYLPYEATGLFTIDFSADKEKLEKCLELISKELRNIRRQKLGKLQLSRAKRQLLSQIAMGEENSQVLLQSLARNLLDYNDVVTMERFKEKIEAVTSADILEAANEVFAEDRISRLVYIPAKGSE